MTFGVNPGGVCAAARATNKETSPNENILKMTQSELTMKGLFAEMDVLSPCIYN